MRVLLTYGEPQDADWYQTFQSTLTYDAHGTGNRSHPIFVPFGYRDARDDMFHASSRTRRSAPRRITPSRMTSKTL